MSEIKVTEENPQSAKIYTYDPNMSDDELEVQLPKPVGYRVLVAMPEVEKTFKPTDLVNASNTASAISRTIQQVGRALVGIFGFKFANIQGLLAARGAFDRSRDIISQKAAEKLIRKEFSAEFGRNINPYIDIGGIISGQEILNQIRSTNAPNVPQGLIER